MLRQVLLYYIPTPPNLSYIPGTEKINEWPILFWILYLQHKSHKTCIFWWSLQIYAHALTAVLLWHEQNLVMIILLWGVNKSKNNKPIQSVIVSKTETNLHYHAHKSSGPWYDFVRACCYVTSNNLSIILQIIYDGLPMAPDTLVYPELHNIILGWLSECHYKSDKISVFRIHDNIISTSCMKWHIIVKSNRPLLGKIITWTFFWDEIKLNAEF